MAGQLDQRGLGQHRDHARIGAMRDQRRGHRLAAASERQHLFAQRVVAQLRGVRIAGIVPGLDAGIDIEGTVGLGQGDQIAAADGRRHAKQKGPVTQQRSKDRRERVRGDASLHRLQAVRRHEMTTAIVERAIHYGDGGPWPGSLQQWQHGLADTAKADDDDVVDHVDPFCPATAMRPGSRVERRATAECRRPWYPHVPPAANGSSPALHRAPFRRVMPIFPAHHCCPAAAHAR